jgi:hypothetical protein
MANNNLVSTFSNAFTIVVGVAFLAISTVGIVSPVNAQTVAVTATR